MYSKNRFTLLLLISSVTTWSFAALGDIADDRKIVTSKAYVDTKQVKIPATTNTYTYDETNRPTADGSVVTTTTTQGVVSERGIATAPVSDGNGGYSNGDWLPTVGAMMNAINTATNTLSWTATETTAVGNYSTTFDGTTGNWPAADADKLIDGTGLATALSNKQNKIIAGTAGNVVTYSGTAGTVGSATVSSAATYTNDTLQNGNDIANITAVETKQDKIVASDILLLEEDGDAIQNDIYTPSIVTHDSNDETLVGTQFGILSNSVIDDADIGWEPPYLYSFDDRDDLVPTVAALIPMFNELWDGIDNVSNTKQDILPAKFSMTNGGLSIAPCSSCGQTIGLTASEGLLEYRYITGAAISPLTSRQNSGGPKPLQLYSVLEYIKGTVSLADFQTNNFGGTTTATQNQNYIKNALVSLETLRGVYADLDAKISANTLPDPLTWDTAETAAANAYSTTFSDSGTNTWPESDEDMVVNGGALANALSLKQNKITTGLVEFYDGGNDPSAAVNVPALVATNSAGTELSGNTIGIVDGQTTMQAPYSKDFLGNMAQYLVNPKYDNFVPSLRALAITYGNLQNDINNIQTYPWTALEWSSSISSAIDAYNATFLYSNTWPPNSENKLINAQFLAQALAKKQGRMIRRFTQTTPSDGLYSYRPVQGGGEAFTFYPVATSSGSQMDDKNIEARYITGGGSQPLTVKSDADNVILYVNGTKTLNEFQLSNFGNTGNSQQVQEIFIQRALVTLELLKDVYSDLNTKIAANSRPTGTAGTVATYSGVTNGIQQFTETAIYDTANAYNATNDANKLATAGFVETKQNKIGATSDGTNNTPNYVYDSSTNPNAAGSVVTTTTTAGTVGQRGIATAPVSDGNGGYSNGDWLPTVNAMMGAINSHTPTGTQNTIANYGANGALGSGIATYDGSGTYAPATDAGKIATAAAVETKQNKIPAGTSGNVVTYTGTAGSVGSVAVASAPSYTGNTLNNGSSLANITAVETKQDKITTGNVMFWDDPEGTEGDISVPGLVAYDPQTSALSGNKIGILDQDTILDHEGFLFYYGTQYGYGSEMDNFVPTVRAVAENLSDLHNTKQDKLPAAWTSTTDISQMASMGGETIDLTAFRGGVGRRYITAGGSQPLTQKAGADNVILYINGTKTLAQYQTSNFGATGNTATTNQNYINGALVSLELLKDVYSALHTEIQNAAPTGTPGNVAMYDATTGELGDGVATYDGSTTYNASTDAGKIATAAAVETKQDKIIAGTAGNVVTYTGTAGSVGSATVSSAATYTNDTLQNGNDIANITAVETKVSKTQSTGYQVLTTGTTGTVTADYISVPVTTSGTGRPTSSNAPTGTAAIWIE